ncbi:MAG TPA: arylsulfatase [Caulifigura sp.]|nr:arylsulfatase [Caulifigura sp.]
MAINKRSEASVGGADLLSDQHRQNVCATVLRFLILLFASAEWATAADRPNIVYILCDDLGYGDVHCLNTDGKIATPRMDGLAKEGMIFTDAHSGSAVCTPTRYGILTGRYAWRTKLQSGVLGGISPTLIEPGRMTVASLLKQHGYHTACVGKWHLGLDWEKPAGKDVAELNIEKPEQVKNVDYSKPFQNGPITRGFDEYFGISASLDMVPYTFLRDDRVVVLPTVDKQFPMMQGRSGGKTRLGPGAPEFEDEHVLPALTKEAIRIVETQASKAKSGSPFFIYLPFASPHTPIAPTAEWRDKSGLNRYADFVMQTDHAIGQVVDAIDRAGLRDNTLIVVTSDNGCSPQAQYEELLPKGHNPSYVFRGTKADIFEGGHHIPFLVRWPAKVKAGSTTDQTVWLGDLMATCAEIVGAKLPDNAGEDSVSILPILEGRATKPVHEAVVHHSINGSFAIRQGDWKLAVCRDSGGWSAPLPKDTKGKTDLPPVQLYNLKQEIGEKTNVQEKNPEVVKRLRTLLEKYIADGRSTPGAPQKNAVEVKLEK